MDRRTLLALFLMTGLAVAPARSETVREWLGDFLGGPAAPEILDPEQAFVLSATTAPDHPREIIVRWDIAPGYYLYRDRFRFTLEASDAALGYVHLPPGDTVTDPEFGEVEVYYREAVITLGLERQDAAAATLLLHTVSQGCKEDTVCYPPVSKTLPVQLPAATAVGGGDIEPGVRERFSPEETISRDLRSNNLWLNLAIFFGFGLLLACTPCVLPMLPILSGIIVGHGRTLTTRRAFVLSLSYVLAMAVTYAILGILAGAMQFNVQAAAQNVWIIGTFSALFVLLAFSMFGFYSLQFPTAWQGWLSTYGIRHQGSLVGATVMGALSAIIVGPCIAPPLAGALLFISQTGNAVIGGAALFALGLGMGLPLLIIGTSAGRLLPRAGVWMETIKRLFGVILLGVAIWFLERVVPPAAGMFLWGALITGTAVYLGALESLAPGESWGRLRKGLGIILLIYGVTLIVGAAAGSGDKLRPLAGIAGERKTSPDIHFTRIKSGGDLDQVLAQAAPAGRVVMLDFYADWCVTCKEMERDTFSHPEVQAELRKISLLQADVTANDALDQALLRRFELYGPPAILFFTGGREQRHLRVIGYMPADAFINHLRSVAGP